MANPFAPVAKTDPGPLDVEWMVAEDEQFLHTVQSGLTRAEPEFGHSVHVQLTGLAPHRWYFYRFRCGNAESPVGRTRTAPATDAALDRFSFAFASCQQYEQGFYSAYRDMAGARHRPRRASGRLYLRAQLWRQSCARARYRRALAAL